MHTTRPAEPEDSAGRAASWLRAKHAGTPPSCLIG
jgi:hypothetical protein